MMPVSIFVSRFGITDLVNKIRIYTNLIKLFYFEILFYGLKNGLFLLENLKPKIFMSLKFNKRIFAMKVPP